jgi:hypothetical protein
VTEVQTYTLTYADVPPSMNTNVGKGHWRPFHGAKKRWQGLFGMLLLKERIPRGATKVKARAHLRFPVRRQRDEGNYRTILEKALGDALQTVGIISDDTSEHFQFTDVIFEEERGANRTQITLIVSR